MQMIFRFSVFLSSPVAGQGATKYCTYERIVELEVLPPVGTSIFASGLDCYSDVELNVESYWLLDDFETFQVNLNDIGTEDPEEFNCHVRQLEEDGEWTLKERYD